MAGLLKSAPPPLRTYRVSRLRMGRLLATSDVRGTSLREALGNFLMTALGQPEPIEELPDGNGGTYAFSAAGPDQVTFRCELLEEGA